MPSPVSIVIPILDEEGNILSLTLRIVNALKAQNIDYEIIFIDDWSKDNSRKVVDMLAVQYPVRYFLKKGKLGKAQSLLEGFAKARFETICMIDGDLQYPPEAIPGMLDKIYAGQADVVVANRKEYKVSLKRKVLSGLFKYVFGKLLHGFQLDVQSGLKVFKKEIIERLVLAPSSWTFDLEFLLKSRDAGYRIESKEIDFAKRQWGKAKISLISASIQLAMAAIREKFRPKIIPLHPRTSQEKGIGFHFRGQEFIQHSTLKFSDNSFFRFNLKQIIFFSLAAVILAASFILNWHLTIVFLVSLTTVLYFGDLLFNLYLTLRSSNQKVDLRISDAEIAGYPKDKWPVYTVFCPFYKEWNMLAQFTQAMEKIDYPKDRLQVLLLLEEDDRKTIDHINWHSLPAYFEKIIIPQSLPKTKPKALNYGLNFARGQYAVIFDAEDIPDPQQLKKVVLSFEKLDEKVVCMQAKLNFYNSHQNLLTKIFTTEYSLWFDSVLTGLQSLNAPIPLGGTSNHFPLEKLKELEGWDAFNVTEDCDLGIRLAKKGYRTAIVDSYTYEEANSDFFAWFKQRSRWLKGYIQTYLVHMRSPGLFLTKGNKLNLIFFQLIVGGKIISTWINPLLWLTTLSYFLFRAQIGAFIESLYISWVFYIGVASLIIGNFIYFYNYMIGAVQRKQWDLVKFAYLSPFYWLMMSVGSYLALSQFVKNPHYWEKTKHGLHLPNGHTNGQARAKIKKISELGDFEYNPAFWKRLYLT